VIKATRTRARGVDAVFVVVVVAVVGVGVGVGVGFVGCCPECDQAHFLLPHIKVCRKSNSVARGPNAEGARHLSL